MNRTALFLGLAAALSLLALVVGLPANWMAHPTTTTTTVITKTDPVDPQPPVTVNNDGSLILEARLSHPYVGAGQSDVFLTMDVKGKQIPGAERSPVNLALVLDRSGSMSGQKLADAKKAARHLVNQLGDNDRLAIIHYGSDVRSFPSAQATPSNRDRMLRYIDNIFDEGGTNIGDGLSTGRDQLLGAMREFKVNRLILISDGQPTEGMTEANDLHNLVRQIRSNGVSVSSIGVGTDFNEDLMHAIAEIGAGSYGYLRDASMLASLFQRDLQAATTTVARNVQLEVELPAGTQLGEVLGYSAVQVGDNVRIDLPDFSAGQLERVVARLSIRGDQVGQTLDVAGVALGYRDLLKDAQAGSHARLSALVTDRKEEIAQHQDREATVFFTRAKSAQNTYEAAESLKRGDRGRAVQLLQANQAMFQEAAAVTGAPAVATDMAEQKEMLDEVSAAKSEEEVQHQVRQSKAKAMKDFGKVSSTY